MKKFILISATIIVFLNLIFCNGLFDNPFIKPYLPEPSNNSADVSLSPELSWKCKYPGANELTYDIYLGKEEPLPLVKANHNSTTYKVTGLKSNTTYYWYIVAKDEHSAESTSATWEFTTTNSPPLVPYDPTPSNGATNVSRSPSLSWECSDPDEEKLTYDIYFGRTATPTLIVSNNETKTFEIPSILLNGTYYYWKVVAMDNEELSSESPIWNFRTENSPPSISKNVEPNDGSLYLPLPVTLKWNSNDPEGDIIYYDVYLGTESDNLTCIATNTTENTKTLDGDALDYGTTYFWRIKATDSKGDYSVGPLWEFSTLETAPDIAFSKCFGGNEDDKAYSIKQTTDGGYIVAGYTTSNHGDVSGNHGERDCWILKLDSSLNMQWQKCLGGTSHDLAYSIEQTNDGGYIVAGVTSSNDGDVSGNHGNRDSWVVKLDSSGNIQWQKCLGGSHHDVAYSIQQTSDGGYIVAGKTQSNNGDVSGNHGGSDFWVVKLDTLGNIIWQKCLGGTNSDEAQSIQQTKDGGYIVAGFTKSKDGDISNKKGSYDDYDYWIIKLDGLLRIEWEKCFDGDNYDDFAQSVQQTSDGGFIVAGYSMQFKYLHHNTRKRNDYMIIKIDNKGKTEWKRIIGGFYEDSAYSIQQTNDKGYVVVGFSRSDDGDVSGNNGSEDFWIVKLDQSGIIKWQKCIGGSRGENARDVKQTSDGGYVVVGYTYSESEEFPNISSKPEYFIVKLEAK